MKTMVLLCIYLCGLYANNLDIVDSKGRSFWDKRFVMYDTNTSLMIKTCENKEWFEEQGLQFDRESRSIIAYTPMERIVLEIQDSKDNIILQGNKFIFLFADVMKYNPKDKYGLEFLDDNSISMVYIWEVRKICAMSEIMIINKVTYKNTLNQGGISKILRGDRQRHGVNIISPSIPIKIAQIQ